MEHAGRPADCAGPPPGLGAMSEAIKPMTQGAATTTQLSSAGSACRSITISWQTPPLTDTTMSIRGITSAESEPAVKTGLGGLTYS